MKRQLNYIDLFAGADELSEGFLHENYLPIAHVEMDEVVRLQSLHDDYFSRGSRTAA